MKRILLYCLGLLLLLGSCADKKRLNRRITFWRNDKIPYGTWFAYNELTKLFPKATVTINKKSPDRYKALLLKDNNNREEESEQNYDNHKTAYIIIANSVIPDDNEVTALLSQVSQGQHVFISSMFFGETLLDSLRLKTALPASNFNMQDSLTVSVENPITADSLSFSYPGYALDNYITSMDSTITSILGWDANGHPNFVRFSYDGGGSIFIHLAPAALTNFFLLHKQNKAYYDNVLSYLPKSTEVVRWDDYFRYHERGDNRSNFSALGWLLKQPSLAAAFWSLLVLLGLIYLFETKRKQRAIPVIPALTNASVDFVKTVGRLYFQRRDNDNLALKMTAHFMDYVRSKYSIRLGLTDPEFINKLSWKTGYDQNTLQDLLYHLKMVQDEGSVSDLRLLELNRKLEHFYKYA